MLLIVCTLFAIFQISIHISTGVDISEIGSHFLYTMVIIFLLVDVLVNINTGYFEKGILMTKRGDILKHYRDSELKVDALSLIPFFLHYFIGNFYPLLELSLLFMFLKIKKFSRISNKLMERWMLGQNLRNSISLIKLLLSVLMISHVFACIWVFIGREEKLYGKYSWLEAKQIDDAVW